MTDTEPTSEPTDAAAIDEQPDVITGTADPSGADAPATLDDPGDPPGEFAALTLSGEPSEGAIVVSFTAKTIDGETEEFASSVFVSGTDDPDVARRFALAEIGHHHPDVELVNVTVGEPVSTEAPVVDDIDEE